MDAHGVYDAGDGPIAITQHHGHLDCVHYGSVVVAGIDGGVVWSCGNGDRGVFERSTVKPFRAVAVVRSGAQERYRLRSRHLAIMSGSHSGTAAHVAVVKSLLSRAGRTADILRCPPQLPLGEDGMIELAARGGGISRLHNECSGEHAGVLLLEEHLGGDGAEYTCPMGRGQRACDEVIDELSTGLPAPMAVTEDRCGMWTALVTLRTLAVRMARFARLAAEPGAFRDVGVAIRRNSVTFAGRGRPMPQWISGGAGEVIGKCGAEGVYTLGWVQRGIGLAVKVADGNHRAAVPVVELVALRLGLPLGARMVGPSSGSFSEAVAIL